eukprot:m.289810 g.289810  ORF g.289810 m.289810 type:complete len:95 (+) comp19971_c0_seq19:182-466(+)
MVMRCYSWDLWRRDERLFLFKNLHPCAHLFRPSSVRKAVDLYTVARWHGVRVTTLRVDDVDVTCDSTDATHEVDCSAFLVVDNGDVVKHCCCCG